MSATQQTTTALLTEHFRYTPLTLLDDIINTVNELVFRAINAIEEGLANTTPEQLGFNTLPTHTARLANLKTEAQREKVLHQLKSDEIDAGIVKLESLLNATVDKDFDKFEIYTLRNILAVGHLEEGLADWVQLDHYKGLDFGTFGAETVTPEDLQLQRRKLHETHKLNSMLKAEDAKNQAVLAQLQTLLGPLPQSQHHGADESTPKANLAFLMSSKSTSPELQAALAQLPALRQLLDQLRSSLQNLPRARKSVDENSTEVKRRRYVDSQSLRVLERRGVGVGNGRAAEAAVAGHKTGQEELQGLERVVQAFSDADR